jgi:hypothetical protein
MLPGAQAATNGILAANLLCAQDLPGADTLDPRQAALVLAEWSSKVAAETERYMYKFRSSPAEYQNSEAYFRVLVMITVLQQDFHVHYNADQIEAPSFADSRDLFLHGILGEKRQGTCVSMPVLYVAVGRRLGYPMKLVTTKAHLFARWERPDGKEKLNIEATNQGLNCYLDDYYLNWPVPMTDEEVRRGHYLQSLTPEEELAVFLSARGHCLEANGRLPEAQLAHAQAHVLVPENPAYLAFLVVAVKKEAPDWQRVFVDLGKPIKRN